MKYVGAHMSVAGGVENSPLRAMEIGCKAMAIFSKNQRRWEAAPLTEESIEKFKKNLEFSKIKPEHVLVHDSYLINLGNADKEKRTKSLNAFIDEIQRVEQLGLKLLNFHPGSHLNEITHSKCIKLIASGINKAIDKTEDAILVIENTAGQGSNLGHTFEQIAEIIDQVENKDRVGVCLDTCHTFAAGYDLADPAGFKDTMRQFEQIIGWKYLKGVHLNDSKFDVGKKKDRHAPIGQGFIGLKPFEWLMNHPKFENIPMALETPEPELWQQEIKDLYKMV